MQGPEKNMESATGNRADSDASLEAVREAVRGLQFGQVTLVIQDGVIVLIERTEKRRLVKRGTQRQDDGRS